MKTKTVFLFGALVLAVLLIFVLRVPTGEDSWIQNEKGVWVRHGNPSDKPDYVLEQEKAILASLELYQRNKLAGMIFSSQCLGSVIDKYSVDIVHVPRATEDNLIQNQCEDYRLDKTTHLIELDQSGNLVRIVN